MQTFSWIVFGQRNDWANESDENVNVAMRQYWRMRKMTVEETFWKMHAVFEGQIKPRQSPTLEVKPQTEPQICICGNAACHGGDLCRECWDEWDHLQSQNQTSSDSGGLAPN